MKRWQHRWQGGGIRYNTVIWILVLFLAGYSLYVWVPVLQVRLEVGMEVDTILQEAIDREDDLTEWAKEKLRNRIRDQGIEQDVVDFIVEQTGHDTEAELHIVLSWEVPIDFLGVDMTRVFTVDERKKIWQGK